MRASFVRSRLVMGFVVLSGLIVSAGTGLAWAEDPAEAGRREAVAGHGVLTLEAAFGKVEVDARKAGAKEPPSPRAGRAAGGAIAPGHRRPPSLGHRGVHLHGRSAGQAIREPRRAGRADRGRGRRKPASDPAGRQIGARFPESADHIVARRIGRFRPPATGGNWCGRLSAAATTSPGGELLSGTPAMFFRFEAQHVPNSVTSTLWCDPLRIDARPSVLYSSGPTSGAISASPLQTIRDQNTWAVYKLWTNWQAPVDLRLEVQGGRLYRRGSFGLCTEVGAVPAAFVVPPSGGSSAAFRLKAGLRTSAVAPPEQYTEEVTLRLGPVDKRTTGYQMAVSLPDKEAQGWLTDFYGSVLNGGAVCDQKGMDFGNESDGWYYAGSCWMNALALAAGVPGGGAARGASLHRDGGLSGQGRARPERPGRPRRSTLRLQPERPVGGRHPGRDPRQPHVHGAYRRRRVSSARTCPRSSGCSVISSSDSGRTACSSCRPAGRIGITTRSSPAA